MLGNIISIITIFQNGKIKKMSGNVKMVRNIILAKKEFVQRYMIPRQVNAKNIAMER